jgi:MOSC domain-containing protein YiiM
MTMLTRITSLHTGRARDRWEGRPPSAIGKEAVAGPLMLGLEGLAGDEQADRAVHGGPEKALHHYPADHYAAWADAWPEHAATFCAGGFGENVSTTGLTEADICLGDRLRLGAALVEICQGRQPCWKLSAHTGIGEMAARLQKSGRTGWYYRVIEPGEVAVGDAVALTERRHPDWPLSRVIAARFDSRLDPAVAAAIAALPELSESWRKSFLKKTDPAFVEDTGARLSGA